VSHRDSGGAGTRARFVVAGAVAAGVWALEEPLDQRLFRCDYSDVAILGKGVTRCGWWPVGFALHVANGALFGLALHTVHARRGGDPRRLALAMALAEHVTLYPLSGLVDRFHPARGEPGLPPLLTNGRAFAQATWRHALFGVLLGRLASRWAAPALRSRDPRAGTGVRRWTGVVAAEPG